MSDDEPMLRVLRGSPTAEELAALVAVVRTRARPLDSADGPVGRSEGGSNWVRSARPGAAMRALPGRHGGGTWRSSALPR